MLVGSRFRCKCRSNQSTDTLCCSKRRLTSLPYNTGGSGDKLDGMVLSPYTLPGQAYSQYNLGLSCAPHRAWLCPAVLTPPPILPLAPLVTGCSYST